MRWFHMGVIALLAAATVIFAFQNLQSVTVGFLGFRLSAPLAVLVAVVYVLGMATGGSLWAFFRWALEGSRRPVTS
jgi:lipopolysaccharide assembly protein A